MRTVRKRTLAVVAEVPPEKEHWRLEPASMSVVDILLHIGAVEKALWGGGNAAGRTEKLDEFPGDALSMAEARDYLAETRAASEKFWNALAPADLARDIKTPAGHSLRLGRWLVLGVEHEIHHRSFIHAYRKIWGLPSFSIYGLTLDQLRTNLAKC